MITIAHPEPFGSGELKKITILQKLHRLDQFLAVNLIFGVDV